MGTGARVKQGAAPVAEAAARLSPLPHGAMGSLPAPHSPSPLSSKWQKGAEIRRPGDSCEEESTAGRVHGMLLERGRRGQGPD